MMKTVYKTVKRTKKQSLIKANSLIAHLSSAIRETTSTLIFADDMPREMIDQEISNNVKELIKTLECFIVDDPEDKYERRAYMLYEKEED